LEKEFLQIFRNRAMLPILFVLPVVQLFILSFAATYELNEAAVALVDHDRSPLSRHLVDQFEANGNFRVTMRTPDPDEALMQLQKGDANMVLTIPQHFHRNLTSGEPVSVQMLIDAVDGTKAGMIQSFGASIIKSFNQRVLPQAISVSLNQTESRSGIELIPLNWYNPDLDYITFMVPGILVVLVSMIGLFLSGMNIVREKEIGTIEQLNVTPIRKSHFIIGKILPFWVIGMIDLMIGLAIARYFFEIPFLGSLFLILAVGGVYLIVIQALGLFISTVTNTQQQAMFIAWFIMVIFILMGGLFTPIESMPLWAQRLTLLNPVSWFIEIMRLVLLKGAGLQQIGIMVIALILTASLFLFFSVRRYRKTSSG
jgi:ABC-2 type transport system permease protein